MILNKQSLYRILQVKKNSCKVTHLFKCIKIPQNVDKFVIDNLQISILYAMLNNIFRNLKKPLRKV